MWHKTRMKTFITILLVIGISLLSTQVSTTSANLIAQGDVYSAGQLPNGGSPHVVTVVIGFVLFVAAYTCPAWPALFSCGKGPEPLKLGPEYSGISMEEIRMHELDS